MDFIYIYIMGHFQIAAQFLSGVLICDTSDIFEKFVKQIKGERWQVLLDISKAKCITKNVFSKKN